MTDLREAAQAALEALRRAVPTGEITLTDWMKANHDLEAALAETEPQEIADLRQACQEGWRYADELDQERKRLEEDLRAALAEPVQEPVAWVSPNALIWELYQSEKVLKLTRTRQEQYGFTVPLYTSPPQRKPLTEEEILLISVACAASHQQDDVRFARAVEAAHDIKQAEENT